MTKMFIFDDAVPLKYFLLSLKKIRKIRRVKKDERDYKKKAT